MYGQHPSNQPTFGAYPGASGYGQPPSFGGGVGMGQPSSWTPSPSYNDDKLGHKPMKDPLLSAIK